MAEHVVPVREAYPNNSERAKNKIQRNSDVVENEEPKKVTKGKIIKRKKPIVRRFTDSFGTREGQGVLEYIINDIIIPATKIMIVDSIINGAEMTILGETRRRSRSSNFRETRYDYDRVSYRGELDRRYKRDRDSRRYNDRDRAGLRDYEDIIFEKNDAEAVISSMIDLIEQYGEATVKDLYSLIGVTPEYTVGEFGWTNLSRATVRRVRDGYVLDFPPPRAL